MRALQFVLRFICATGSGVRIRPADQGLLAETLQFAASSRADSTRIKYNASWLRFRQWCNQRTPPYKALPAEPYVVAMYLRELSTTAPGYSVVKAASAAIFAAHDAAGVEDPPTSSVICKNICRAAKRQFGVAIVNKKRPMHLLTLKQVVSCLLASGSAWDIQVAAFCAVLWAGCLRYSDLRCVCVKHLTFLPTHLELHLVLRKNDQFRAGHVVFLACGQSECCPVRLLKAVITCFGLTSEHILFQRRVRAADGSWSGDGKFWSYSCCQYWVLGALARALGKSVQDIRIDYGVHSFRSGGATAAASSVDVDLVQAHGGWRERTSVLGYIDTGLDQKLSVSRSLGY